MMSLQEMSDRLEIQDLIARYAYAIDDCDFDALDNVFTPDAIIDYHELGGSVGTLSETKAFLAKSLPNFPGFQHMCATTKIDFDGDTAKTRTILFNPMVAKHEGKEQVFFVGLWYEDEMVRTPEGWRIRKRYERASWNYNVPPGLVPDVKR